MKSYEPTLEDRDRPVVAIVGAGFAGLWAAKALSGRGVDVVLIDRNNYHTFLPLLYQVAAAEIGPSEIAYPIRSILRDLDSVDFKMAEVRDISAADRWVMAGEEKVHYDRLIIATGSVPNYFRIPGAEEHAFALRTMDDAIPLRHHILRCFEAASTTEDEASKRALLTFSIVGAGATGVEYAGALAELIRGPLLKDYPSIEPDLPRILLVEASSRVLPGMDEALSSYAHRRLEARGVEVLLDTSVAEVGQDRLSLSDADDVRCDTVIWTAGVKGTGSVRAWDLAANQADRLEVEPTLQLVDHPEIFAAGDLPYLEAEGRPLPQVAPVAIQSGTLAAENVLRSLTGRPLVDFEYEDPGMLAVIGRYSAVGELGGVRLTGLVAWVVWAAVHVLKLVGFRNRILVLTNWAWNYFSWGRATRLILPAERARRRRAAEPSGTS